ncbi:MAG TPA: type II secretion system protein GspD [Gammaproteobacteria bacterium]|nr:type II secretion system protein GspD [Gammaproteobacteria bacterium]
MNLFMLNKFVLVSLTSVVLLISFALNSAQINMRDADIRAFAADMAQISNKTIVLDPRVKGNVTVVSNQDLDAGEAYAVFLSVLRVHGYAAIENNGVVKVMPESGARQDATVNNKNNDSLATEVIRLSQANARTIAPLLKPLVNKQGHIAAYEATNSIIIADYVGNLSRIKSILLELDRNPADTFELIPLDNTSANEVARILGSMWRGDNQMSKSFSAIAVESSNLKVIYLKYAKAEDLTGILEKVAESLEEEIPSESSKKNKTNIGFHNDTNALIISAQPDILKSLESVISQLDIRRAQVLVEALIVEISDKLARDLGVQFLFLGDGESSPIATQRFGTPNPDLISTIGAETSEDSTTSSTMQTRAANSLLALDGLAVGVARYKASGTSFATILNLIAQDADSNVLSTPSIMTMDNEEASIVVGQEIPITTGETLSGSNSNPFRSVTRQEIGVKLTVRPQINEGNAVKMYINQEVSSIFGPLGEMSTDLITNKRNIKTTVLVEDGETIVLGGLIDDDVQESVKKVPFLGDIPLLGRLFKTTSITRTKRNLMVFLRPTIVRNSEDVRAISNRKYNYFQAIENDLINSGKMVPDTTILKDLLESDELQ